MNFLMGMESRLGGKIDRVDARVECVEGKLTESTPELSAWREMWTALRVTLGPWKEEWIKMTKISIIVSYKSFIVLESLNLPRADRPDCSPRALLPCLASHLRLAQHRLNWREGKPSTTYVGGP